jgi:hypothetical protein
MIMANWRLSEDLERLERRLVQRACEEPSIAVRGRVLASVRAALRRQRSGGWRLLAAGAAGVLLGLNLALSATTATDGIVWPHGTPESVERTARQIERLLPDLPYEEAVQHAIRYQSGSALVPCPEVSARPLNDPSLAESPGW